MKRFIFVILILALVLGSTVSVFAAEKKIDTAAQMTLEDYKGTVTIKDAAGKNVSPRVGLTLCSGYTIQTGASSKAYIALDKNSKGETTKAILLQSSSKLILKKTKNGNKIDIMLEYGTIATDTSEPVPQNKSYDIHSTNNVTGIRGTGDEVQYEPVTGKFTNKMYDGQTQTVDKFTGQVITVGAGQGLTVMPHTDTGTGNGNTGGAAGSNVNAPAGSSVVEDIGLGDLTSQTQELLIVNKDDVSDKVMGGVIETFGLNDLSNQQMSDLVQTVNDAVSDQAAADAVADANAAGAVDQIQNGVPEAQAKDPVFDKQDGTSSGDSVSATSLPDQLPDPASGNTVTATDDSSSGGSSSGGSSGGSGGGSSGNPADSKALMEDLADGSATINPGGWTISYTGVTVGDGQTLNITGSGTASMPDLKIAEGGTVNVDSGSTLAVSGSASAVDGTLNNNGTVNMNGVTINAGDNIVVNQGSTLSFTGGTNNNYGTITNNGTLINEQGSTLNNLSANTIVNAGSFINRGVFNNGSSSNSGRVVNTNGTINNSGTFTNNYGEITLDGTVTGVSFTVRFDANGGAVGSASVSVNFGGTVSAQEVEKEGSEFNGWFYNGSAYNFSTQVVRDITLTAQWTDIPAPTTADYTVKHMLQDLNGNTFTEKTDDTRTLNGTIGENTAAEANSYTGFEPLSITQQTINADGSTVVEVKYERLSYAVKFVDDNGNTIGTEKSYPYGTPASSVTVPADPSKEADAQYTYAFTGWNNEIADVTAEATYTATFSSTVNKYDITWVDG
ncbi:MAG: InlB B-repeat-containing protein, partial [Firmicutes bacterium]|nr:InlB B-repeat-containing protein [Bacillota bacterium]